jgi:hypothetical protein
MKSVEGFERDSIEALGEAIDNRARIWDRIVDIKYHIYKHQTQGYKFTALVVFEDN